MPAQPARQPPYAEAYAPARPAYAGEYAPTVPARAVPRAEPAYAPLRSDLKNMN